MLKNWYLAIFAILLAAAGVGFVPYAVPNQEIVVQFTETVSEDETDVAMAQVRAQLLSLGVEDLQIKQQDNGYLKITYYSDVAISQIQEILASNTGGLAGFQKTSSNSNSKELPFQKALDTYTFTVSEIGGNTDFDPGLKGLVLDVESKSSRFYPPNFFSSAATIAEEDQLLQSKISITIDRQLKKFVDTTSRLFPETRAGPLC